VPVTAGSSSSSHFGRRGAVAAGLLGLVAALSFAVYSRPDLSSAAATRFAQGFSSLNTVAAMLAARSPGIRSEGALVNVKPERQPAVHERALPKVRGPGPLAGFSAPAAPPPFYDLVTAGPVIGLAVPPPIDILPPAGGGAPGIFLAPPPPGGGGGGGIFIPPPAATPLTPVTLSAVPEPSSWAMMLVGFAMIGRGIGRRKAQRKLGTT